MKKQSTVPRSFLVPDVQRRYLLRSAVVAIAAVVPVLALTSPSLADDKPGNGDTVVGELVQAWPEDEKPHTDSADEGPLSWIATDDGDSVRVPTTDVAHLPLGATVEVTLGRAVRDAGTTQHGLPPAQDVVAADVVAAPDAVPTAPAASQPVTDEVTVVLVAPAGLTPDATDVNGLVQTVNEDVANFWERQSDGAIRLGAHAGSPTWVTSPYSCDDPFDLWGDVASKVGFRLDADPAVAQHLLLYVPGYPAGMPSCAYGLAQVGPARTYGGYAYVRDTLPSVIAHELGHNFGLGHSSLRQCDGATEGGSCATRSYDDLYDVMGASWNEMGSLSVAQAARIGVLPAGQQQALTMSDPETAVTLAPVSGTTGTRAVRLTGPDGTVYWLEYRPAADQDGWLGSADAASRQGLEPGVLLRRWTTPADSPGDSALLLDGTPSVQRSWSADRLEALPIGTPVRFAGGVFTVTVTGEGTDATVDVVPESPIGLAHDAAGGDTGSLGAATAAEGCSSGICSRSYEHGVIYWSAATGAHAVQGDLLSAWTGAGGATGALGLPRQDAVCGLVRGGCGQDFQGGSLYTSPGTGTHALTGAVRGRWQAEGAQNGYLGYPTGEMSCGLRDGGCAQGFEGGALYWSPSTGAHGSSGALRWAWANNGAEGGWLGYPTGEMSCGLRGGGCAQGFQGGALYWSPASGAHSSAGGIRWAWALQGAEAGWLGYPLGDVSCGLRGGGCGQPFQGGTLYWSSWTGTRAVSGGIGSTWARSGAEHGWLGYPTGDMVCQLRDGGCAQAFETASLYWSPTTNIHAVMGAIRGTWERMGAQDGSLGYPVDDMTCDRVGCRQSFQRGSLVWTARNGQIALR
jgi:hypothetical protein